MKVALSRIFAGSRRATLRSAKAFSATFFLTLFATTQPAAAAISFGEVFCNVADNMSPFIQVFNLVAYVAAIFFIIQGLLHLKGYYDNPNQHPLHKSILLLSVGSVFTILPVTFKTLISTLFVTGSTGPSLGISSCAGLTTSTGATSAGGTVTLDAMLANFVGNIKEPLTFLISVVAITLGAFLIVRGLMKAAKYGQDARQHSMHNILTNLIIGTILVVFGQSVDMMMLSVLGVSASGGGLLSFSNLAWSSLDGFGSGSENFKIAIEAALTFFQLVGLISFVRGWNIIRLAVEGQGQATVPQGITHIVGGVLAINIYLFMQIMDATFGTTFVS